jgi:hypothetical protein
MLGLWMAYGLGRRRGRRDPQPDLLEAIWALCVIVFWIAVAIWVLVES